MTVMFKTRTSHQLRNKNNEIVTTPDELKIEWVNDVQKLNQEMHNQAEDWSRACHKNLKNVKTC